MSICIPENPVGIIQLVHGMAEHRERYHELMEYFVHSTAFSPFCTTTVVMEAVYEPNRITDIFMKMAPTQS